MRRYGQVIGFATADIAVGDHVHTQNLAVGDLHREYEVGTDVRPVNFYPPDQMRYFDGYLREDGRVGTRNYVAIISGVNCSASVSQFVKDKFRDVSKDYPNIDGVLAVTHKSGCGTELFGEDHMALQRVLAGYAKHPNVAAYILIGLGCEVNQAAVMVDKQRMAAPGHPERKPLVINIQEAGGIKKTVEKAAAEVAKLLPLANAAKRSKQPVSEITARHQLRRLRQRLRHHRQSRPGLGGGRARALRRHGGARGDARDLRRRAPPDPPRGERGGGQEAHRSLQVVGMVLPGHRAHGQQPRPRQQGGRHHHGLREVAGRRHQGRHHSHDGRVPLRRADHHARLRLHGHPGHDPVSITGLVAGGCNLICFTTGRGSVFGCKPVPSIKLATNSLMYRHMQEDMDINCGVILEGTPLPEVGRQIFEEIVAVASGKQSKSELSGVGEEEFAPG